MPRHSMIPLVLVLMGCHRYEDTGRVCVLPDQVECFASGAASETGFEFDACVTFIGEGCDCQGHYPADQAYQVHAQMSEGGGGFKKKEKCDVELAGDHQLLVKSSFWEKSDADNVPEGVEQAEATCSTPVLTAGEWTLRYGEDEVVFLVGDPDIQDIACAGGGP